MGETIHLAIPSTSIDSTLGSPAPIAEPATLLLAFGPAGLAGYAAARRRA
jgi:hypothetical protein